jgi:hypothetical protein
MVEFRGKFTRYVVSELSLYRRMCSQRAKYEKKAMFKNRKLLGIAYVTQHSQQMLKVSFNSQRQNEVQKNLHV